MIGAKSIIGLAILSCILCQHQLLADAEKAPEGPTTLSPPKPDIPTTAKPTEKPTTAKPTDAPTTAKPTEKPTPKPAPPAPKKYPQNVGSFAVQDQGRNMTCIVLKAAMQISINFTSTISNKTEVGFVDVPEGATAGGSCAASMDQDLKLEWPVVLPDNSTQKNQLSFAFHKEQVSSGPKPEYAFAIKSVTATLFKDNVSFPGATEPSKPIVQDLGLTVMEFMTPLGHYFGCKSEQVLKSENNSSLVLKFQSLELQAFSGNLFNRTELTGKENNCPEDEFTIGGMSAGAVFGIILLVLIITGVVVGGLYFVKKRRDLSARAYENM